MKKFIVTNTNKQFLKELPKYPGVYLFYDNKDEVIYVGRAANLKTRVSSYFVSVGHRMSNRYHKRPIEQFMREVKALSVIEVNNLLEAAVLENNLIKKYWPKYNIKDKDHKTFVYLFFNMVLDFPKPVIVRARDLEKYKPEKGKGVLTGPFQSYREAKNILHVARQLFPYSVCKPNSGKPCFHNQIGLCPGACVGEITPAEYKKNIRKLIKFLESNNPKADKKMLDDISLMPSSREPVFYSNEVQRIEAYDISYFKKGETYGSMVVFLDSEPSKEDYRLFKIREAKQESDVDALKEMIERRMKHTEWKYPDIIVVDGGRQQVSAVAQTIGEKLKHIPIVGISKAGQHSESSSKQHKVVFRPGVKKSVRELLSAQKGLFKKATAEAHRFAIKAVRKKSLKQK